MDEDENDDAEVWNASAVVLDIDSGMLSERHTFIFWNDIEPLQPFSQL